MKSTDNRGLLFSSDTRTMLVFVAVCAFLVIDFAVEAMDGKCSSGNCKLPDCHCPGEVNVQAQLQPLQ